MIEAVDAAAADDNVWVVAITGSGDAFCAGLDLAGRASPIRPDTPQTAQLDDIGWVGQFLLAIRKRCDKPVVGGINGVAVGAGLGLAMATDVRLIAPQRAADGRLHPHRRLAGRRPHHHPAAGHGLREGHALHDGEPHPRSATRRWPGAWPARRSTTRVRRAPGRILPVALRLVADHASPAEARHRPVLRDHRPGAAAPLRGRQHPQGLRQRGRPGGPPRLPRKAQAGVPGALGVTAALTIFDNLLRAGAGGDLGVHAASPAGRYGGYSAEARTRRPLFLQALRGVSDATGARSATLAAIEAELADARQSWPAVGVLKDGPLEGQALSAATPTPCRAASKAACTSTPTSTTHLTSIYYAHPSLEAGPRGRDPDVQPRRRRGRGRDLQAQPAGGVLRHHPHRRSADARRATSCASP